MIFEFRPSKEAQPAISEAALSKTRDNNIFRLDMKLPLSKV
ncbi:MAG TPA: hypothetical protein PL001_11955 [Candidatus Kryptobacter bacterium]|nr:hypothetical protein [Candidatus Kryptobacter bacterium]